MNEDATPKDPAEMQAMAEQAEADAAAADALAAAAGARARALRLRRQAEIARATAEGETRADEPVENALEQPAAQDTGTPVPPTSGGQSRSAADDEPLDDADGDADSASSTVFSGAAGSEPAWYRRRPRRRALAVIAASLLVIVVLASMVGSMLILLHHRHAAAHRQQAAEFAAAAREGVVTLTSLDFHNAKQGVQRIVDNSTGAFRADFTKTADDFVKLLNESQVVEQGTVRATAVDLGSMTNDSAVVLVVSTSEVTGAAGGKRDSRSFRLLVTVNRDGDQLKMSKVEFVL